MADTDSKDGPGEVNLETHPLVARLHADPDEYSEAVALVGYLGPSNKTDYVRLYVDLSFRNYYEIPAGAVVSTTPADASDENSPTTVHVSGDARLEKVSVTSQSVEARFLQGSISAGYLGTAGGGAASEAWTFGTCAQAGAQAGGPSMVYSCWCPLTRLGCPPHQAAQPYTDTVFASCACSLGQYTCNNCGQAGAQANAQPWPASPTCWCNLTQNNCAQAQAEPWPASPTCWCNITRNCGQQAAQPYTDTLFSTCACTYEQCGQAAAPGNAALWPVTGFCNWTKWHNCNQGQAGAAQAYWPASPTCWCWRTQQCA